MKFKVCLGWGKDIVKRLIPGMGLFPDPPALELVPAEEGNARIKELLYSDAPFLAGRVGSTELRNLLYINGLKFALKAPPRLEIEAGIFPGNFTTAKNFVAELEAGLELVDVLISFGWSGEGYLKNYLREDVLVTRPHALEPYLLPGTGWWHALRGKRVLIVNSFASFLKERLTRETLLKLWPQEFEHIEKILPRDCIAINTPYGWESKTKSKYRSYADVLDDLKNQISNTDYDVALIACGGIGLPLAAWVKSQGKQAIHVGGVLQVWGGIKGKRFMTEKPWDAMDKTYWVNAPDSTRPSSTDYGAGCYW
ncbi:MAG: hypothetical protein JKX99_02430 [Robiginitomaculum sp.]|nr:hypothetical protein [Robiginitomaculum sp.]